MEVWGFEEMQAEFMARVGQAVYCTMATIDRQNRPRSRVVHPIWDGPIGWVISWPASHKAKHLALNPAVSLAYIPDKAKPVYVDGVAEWIDAVEEKRRIWDLHRTTPAPLGFDPQPHSPSEQCSWDERRRTKDERQQFWRSSFVLRLSGKIARTDY